MRAPSTRSRPAHRRRAVALIAVGLVTASGCARVNRLTHGPLERTDSALYELEITRCEIESASDTLDALGEPLVGDTWPPHLVLEYTITNRDTERRRFDLRATTTDADGLTMRLIGHQTNRRDPEDSTTGVIRDRVTQAEVPPFTCEVDVWDSVVDRAFPDD